MSEKSLPKRSRQPAISEFAKNNINPFSILNPHPPDPDPGEKSPSI